jgi:hypothetical protein
LLSLSLPLSHFLSLSPSRHQEELVLNRCSLLSSRSN